MLNRVQELENIVKRQSECIANKLIRISELQRDIDGLKRRNGELLQELAVKDYIIKQQVIQMQKG